MEIEKKVKKDPDSELLAEAKERYQECSQACEETYKQAIEDIDFVAGNQWSSEVTKDRKDRPSLVENRLAITVQQVCNDQRQNKPMGKVVPRDSSGDEDVAEVIDGLLRFIQNSSDSQTAFDTAFDQAVSGGIGWYRIITDYCDEESFEQDIIIKRIPDFNTVKFPIHLTQEIDGRDMPYCFIESTMSKEAFEEEYPDVDIQDWQSNTPNDGWVTGDDVKVCEYFVVEKKPQKIYKLSSGEITREKPEDESQIVDSRDTYKRKIKWYKITSNQILERRDFPGQWIPVIPIVGKEINNKGKKLLISITRNAKDPQRMLNYWRSAEAEKIALAPKTPFIAAGNQLENYEDEWSECNRSNRPVLHYNPVMEGGVLVPPPQRVPSAPVDMAIINASKEAIDAIKACTGVFDAGLGSTGNEKSGKAILARQREGDTSNFHFFDNFAKSLRHCFRIIVDMIPEVIDTERAVRILGNDMKEKIVTVNKEHSTDGSKLYDLKTGKYDVIVETGPSYLSKQQETAQTIREMGQTDPVIVAATRDQLAKYIGLPAEFVERLQKTIDPNLLQDDKKQNPQAVQAQLMQANQQAQMQLQQLDQVIQKMSAELEQANLKLQTKSEDNSVKLEIAKMNAQVALLIEEARLTQKKYDHAHEVGLESMKHAHSLVHSDIVDSRNAENREYQQSPGTNPESSEQG